MACLNPTTTRGNLAVEVNPVFKLMLELPKNEKNVAKGTKFELFAPKILQQIQNPDNVLCFEKIREYLKSA